MKIFSPLYRWTMKWSRHPRAPWFLGMLSFAESSFFPIPQDVMLAPMCLANPKRAWWYALLTTATSILGGLFGYLIGFYAFSWIEPFLRASPYWDSYQTAVGWFETWGFWAVFIAGFSPIPYKVFTIAAGVFGVPLPTLIIASILSRGARFLLVAGMIYFLGDRVRVFIEKYFDALTLLFTVLLVGDFFLIRFLR